MNHYYFHIINGGGLTHDEEGRRCDSHDDAKSWAIDQLRSLLADDVRHGTLDLDARITIAASPGNEVATVRFEDAVTIRKQDQRAAL